MEGASPDGGEGRGESTLQAADGAESASSNNTSSDITGGSIRLETRKPLPLLASCVSTLPPLPMSDEASP